MKHYLQGTIKAVEPRTYKNKDNKEVKAVNIRVEYQDDNGEYHYINVSGDPEKDYVVGSEIAEECGMAIRSSQKDNKPFASYWLLDKK